MHIKRSCTTPHGSNAFRTQHHHSTLQHRPCVHSARQRQFASSARKLPGAKVNITRKYRICSMRTVVVQPPQDTCSWSLKTHGNSHMKPAASTRRAELGIADEIDSENLREIAFKRSSRQQPLRAVVCCCEHSFLTMMNTSYAHSDNASNDV